MIGHFTDDDVVLEFLAGEHLERLAGLGTSCPDHFIRTKVRPLVLDLPADAPLDECVARLQELQESYQRRLSAPTTNATPTPHSPAMRGADSGDRARARRRHVLVRQGQADRAGRGRVLRQRDQRDARRRGDLDVRADPGGREVPHRVLGARGGETPTDARAAIARRAHRARHRRGGRHRQGDRHPARRRRRVRRGRRPRPRSGERGRRRRSAPATSPSACRSTSPTPAQVQAAIDAALLAFGGVDLVVNNAGLSISKSLARHDRSATGTCSTT